MLKTNIITGLDIGNNTIKLVQLKKSPLGWRIIEVFKEDIPLEVQFQEQDRFSYTVETLKKAIQQKPAIKNSFIVSAIKRHECIVKYIKFPSQEKEEIEKMLPFELEKYVPPSLGKVVSGYQIIDTEVEPGEKVSEVLVVFTKREVVDNHLRLLAEAGLKPGLIDLTSLSLYNSFVQKHPEEKKIIVILEIGTQTTEIDILDSGLLKFTRSAPIGGATLNQMLQKELGADLLEIEKMKVGNEIFTKDKFREIGENWGRLLRNEISQSLEAFRTERQKKKIEKIYMSGGGSKLVGLADYLERKLGIPVVSFDPFPLGKSITGPWPRELAHLFPVALGLAYRGLKTAELQVNLIPEELSQGVKRAERKKLATYAALAVAVVLAFMGLKGYMNFLDKKKQIGTITQELAAHKKEIEIARELQGKIRLYEDRSQNKEMVLETLKQLSEIAPPNVYIDHFVFTKEGQINIQGKTESHGAAANFAIQLEKSNYFDKVVNKGSHEIKYGDTTVVEFEIDCLIKGFQGAPVE